MTTRSDPVRSFAALVAVVAASALVLQYGLLIGRAPASGSVLFLTVRFFSYFTILSNLLVLLVTASAAFAPESSWGRWFAQATVRGGVALYIGVTMGIYATVLRQLWEPQGAQWWADSSLHYAVPTLYLAWWLFAVPHGTLRWAHVLRWLLFPAGYLSWVLARGIWAREYPYPFLDLAAHDLPVVLRNCTGVFALFLMLGSVLVLVDRWRGRVLGVVART
jgi:hypothetical protein